MLNIVLVEPDIPQNTGTIGRLCVNLGARLHLIRPLGFDIDDKAVKRAGLDYWKELDLVVWESFDEFLQTNPVTTQMHMATTKSDRLYWDCKYGRDDFILFGSETRGIDERVLLDNPIALGSNFQYGDEINLSGYLSQEPVFITSDATLGTGNVVIDSNGDIWITPSAVDKGSLKGSDIICVKKGGEIIGKHKPSSEFPFHKAIYESRPDIKSIIHAHPPALVSFSIVHQIPNTNIISQAKHVCGPIGYAKYEIPGSDELGEVIGDEFKKVYNSTIIEIH